MFVRVKSPRRILVIRPDVIGDVVLTTPLILSLKNQYPDADIYTLQQPYTAPLLTDHPSIKGVLLDWKKTDQAKGLLGFFRYARYIRSFHFDMVVHVYLDGYYAALAWQAGIPIRIGDSNKLLLRMWLNAAAPQPIRNLPLHEVEQNLALMKIYAPALKSVTSLSLSRRESDMSDARKKLAEFGLTSDSHFILIHPTTGNGNRAWHPEKYAELIDRLFQKTDYTVVLTGHGPKDATTEALIRLHCKSPFISLVNQTTLPELMGVVQLACVVVGTDTGPTHIAAAFHIPVIGISPTKFVKAMRWAPWETPHRIVGHPESCNVVCTPSQCTLTTCLDAISVDEVFETIQDLLKNPTPSPQPKRDWAQQSLRVMIWVQKDSERLDGESLAKRCKDVGLHPFLYNGSSLNLLQAIAFITTHDCTVVHSFSKLPTAISGILRAISAPRMSCPPIFVFGLPNPTQDIRDFYMVKFEKWHPN